MTFSKILVANRGEIARRVMRSARKLGYRTVAVFSDADRDSPHVREADEAVRLGPPAPRESYLAIDKVLAAAAKTGADAIHPGYGFLSENANFARACADAGVCFVGPPAQAIELMGSKRAAKAAMLEAGVPCVPGYQGGDQSDDAMLAAAESIGWPVMIKASAGGGGRGMRLVEDAASFLDALGSARSEATNAFGDGELILEKAIVRPRHVEIQVFGDTHGNVIHLGERDCSLQRRHQKVLEESPSPAVDAALRARMGDAAVKAAKACGYVGAGTVELLLGGEDFYFLEMNTRLQVEHPVTELVTGVDLVEWQLRVAAGEPLPLSQEDVRLEGHAVEARLYAEDPRRGFMPQTGLVLHYAPAPDARVDDGIETGQRISPHYDSMVAKVIVHGRDRREALRRLDRALSDTRLLGLRHNKAFLRRACQHPELVENGPTTAFIAEHMADDPVLAPTSPSTLSCAAAALVQMWRASSHFGRTGLGWRSGGPLWSSLVLATGDEETQLEIARQRGPEGRFDVRRVANDEVVDELSLVLDSIALPEGDRCGQLRLSLGDTQTSWRFSTDGNVVWLDDGSDSVPFEDVTQRPARSADAAGSGRLVSPLDGAVTKVLVAEGDRVERGQLLMIVEAMKMEHQIQADVDGQVATVHAAAGEQVDTRQLLVTITADDDEEAG